jgi:hypothetical protein
MPSELDAFVQSRLAMNGNLVPGRLQSAIALLERLRSLPDLRLDPHLTEGGQSLVSHEQFGNSAHTRLGIEAINKNHGRRSSFLSEWGQDFLDLLERRQFDALDEPSRARLIGEMQDGIAVYLRQMLDREPISVRTRNRTAESVVADVMCQAAERQVSGQVAQYLVGAKLLLRFPLKADLIIPQPSNVADRQSRTDPNQRRGDFDLGECVFEIAMGMPDQKHISQVIEVAEEADTECWLIVSESRLGSWKTELESAEVPRQRVVVASIELFVGQNISELGDLSVAGKCAQLVRLFDIYNEKWASPFGPPGTKIIIKD